MKKIAFLFIIIIFASCTSRTAPEIDDVLPTPDYSNIATIDNVIYALQNPDYWVVIDVRSVGEFNGLSRLPNAYGTGRIKGSVNINVDLAFNPDGRLLSYDELMELYAFIGYRSVIVYCHGGVRSARTWGVLTMLGFHAYNYEGSWIDWSRAASVADGYPNELVLSLTEMWTDNEGEI